MKAGLTTSVILHVAVLGFGLVSLSAPRPFELQQESLPVDIIPVEEFSQATQGDEKAPMAERSAPLPTRRPDIVADAQKVGENSVDTEAPVTPDAKPRPVETAAAPAPQPKPVEKPKDEETPKPAEEPTPVPATEAAPTPAPKQEVKPDPVKETPKPEPVKQPEPAPAPEPEQTAAIEPTPEDSIAEAIEAEQPPKEEAAQLPDSAPTPESRPRPAEAQTAKAPDRKAAEKPVKEAASKPKSDEQEFSEDKVAALLNKQKASGGGAKRSTETAALGGKKKTGEKLSNSEMGALSDQLSNCWAIPAGAEGGDGLRVSVKFRVDSSGKLDGRPEIASSSGNRPFDESAVRAVQKCDRDGLILPAGKEEIWAEVVVNFDPTEMGM
ncbi:energy transducer TonB family protein [Arvimicrobium flavum]|uniref:energy transducer TonB family protein n=1 Tax=Arvimicrobium flavum TaxID=3393320 RepID=UPI00237A65DD|nr:TonB family protein [Mesorhizobium shangrilense]